MSSCLFIHIPDNDSSDNKHSALKVVKSAGRYAETARDEIKLLRKVMSANPLHPGHSHVVSMLDSFQHCAPEDIHVCIVFEPLGENLLALIERNNKTGIPVALVKMITKQVLLGLQYLHDECDLVSTDIKPENICSSNTLPLGNLTYQYNHSDSHSGHRVSYSSPIVSVSLPHFASCRHPSEISCWSLDSPTRVGPREACTHIRLATPRQSNHEPAPQRKFQPVAEEQSPNVQNSERFRRLRAVEEQNN